MLNKCLLDWNECDCEESHCVFFLCLIKHMGVDLVVWSVCHRAEVCRSYSSAKDWVLITNSSVDDYHPLGGRRMFWAPCNILSDGLFSGSGILEQNVLPDGHSSYTWSQLFLFLLALGVVIFPAVHCCVLKVSLPKRSDEESWERGFGKLWVRHLGKLFLQRNPVGA